VITQYNEKWTWTYDRTRWFLGYLLVPKQTQIVLYCNLEFLTEKNLWAMGK